MFSRERERRKRREEQKLGQNRLAIFSLRSVMCLTFLRRVSVWFAASREEVRVFLWSDEEPITEEEGGCPPLAAFSFSVRSLIPNWPSFWWSLQLALLSSWKVQVRALLLGFVCYIFAGSWIWLKGFYFLNTTYLWF